jgi:dTDP-4-dehydrorhamnose reductase
MKKKLLIFGPHGQLGSDLCLLLKNSYELLPIGHEMADVTKAEKIEDIIGKESPDIIINASAYNKVDQSDKDIAEAFALNAFAPYYMAGAAKKVSAVFINVSTDYVFDGSKKAFTEDDETHPLNVYGLSKLAGEQLVKNAGLNFYIIRTSGLFGQKQSSQKLNFVDRMVDLAKKGEELKVVDDLVSSPTYSADLAEKIKQLIELPAPFGVYHITNAGSCSWYELAKKTLELTNLKANLQAQKYTSEKINRPKFSVLENRALTRVGIEPMPSWEDALGRYLKEKHNK